MAPPATPIEGFDRLTDTISISQPKASQTSRSASSPSMIVYCAWMGASRKHVAKYTAGWRKLYPNATILVVENTVRGVFTPQDLSAANDAITAHLSAHPSVERADGSEKTGIVLAAASNGGVLNAVRLSNRLCHVHERAPFDALVLDCSPSLPRAAEGARALAAIVRGGKEGGEKGLVYAVAYWVFYVALLVWGFVTVSLFGHEDLLVGMRRDLNSTSLFPRVTPRLYLYSRADRMVRWEDVREHAEEAKNKRKYRVVREEVFEKARHVALITEDAERYWRSIKEVIDAAT